MLKKSFPKKVDFEVLQRICWLKIGFSIDLATFFYENQKKKNSSRPFKKMVLENKRFKSIGLKSDTLPKSQPFEDNGCSDHSLSMCGINSQATIEKFH